MPGRSIAVQLDWPPSMNTYWRRAGHRIYLSARGRQFKDATAMQCRIANVTALQGRIAMQIELSPPTKRKVDIDNRIKAVLDALQGWCYYDDEQIDRLVVIRRPIAEGGGCLVVVAEM